MNPSTYVQQLPHARQVHVVTGGGDCPEFNSIFALHICFNKFGYNRHSASATFRKNDSAFCLPTRVVRLGANSIAGLSRTTESAANLHNTVHYR